MQYDKKYKLHKCVSKDASRPALQSVYFDKAEKSLVITNGTVLAKIAVSDCEQDQAALIDDKAFASTVKGKGIAAVSIQDGKLTDTCTGVSMPIDPETEYYPAYERVMPKQDEQVTFKLGINAKELFNLSQALGNEKLVLSFYEKGFETDDRSYKSAITVRAWDEQDTENVGLIMPMKINND